MKPVAVKVTGSMRVFQASSNFCFGGERDGVGDVADVEVWNGAEDALLLFDLDLGLGYVLRRGGDLHVDGE